MIDDLDDIDRQILTILQEDGRVSNSELAQRVRLAPPTVLRRVKLLEERGYIKGYTAILDPLLLGLTVTAFIFIETDIGCELDTLAESFSQVPEIQEIHRVIGEWCFLLKVRTSSPQELGNLIHRKLRNYPGVRRTHTTLATSSSYETLSLPLSLLEQTNETVEL